MDRRNVVLQTRTVPADVVRGELERWKSCLRSEYQSLVQDTEAVQPLDDQELRALANDATQKIELIPGRAMFAIKAPSGRLKARVVACGSFQNSVERGKTDVFASGISAEGVRLLLRRAALDSLAVGTLDVKTASLNAPVVTPTREKVMVRVPSILRSAGICEEKYWLVQKALYGLDVAPRSWALHRNETLQSVKSLADGILATVQALDEDASICTVEHVESGKVLTWLTIFSFGQDRKALGRRRQCHGWPRVKS